MHSRFLENWGRFFVALHSDECWLLRAVIDLKGCQKGFCCVSTRVLTMTHSALLFRTSPLPEMASSSSLCVQACMCKCVDILCVYTQAVEIWNTPVIRNKTSALRSDRVAEMRRAILKQKDMNRSAFHIVRLDWGLAATDREKRSY